LVAPASAAASTSLRPPAGIIPQPVPTYSYDVSKAAVHHLTRKLSAELAPCELDRPSLTLSGLLRVLVFDAPSPRYHETATGTAAMNCAVVPLPDEGAPYKK